MIKEVGSSKILETAMALIHSARKNIKMTMRANEEIENPLPAEYFSLLQKKMNVGVKISRIGFGNTDEFNQLEDRVYINSPNYAFRRSGDSDYRRMLLVDNSRLMFARIDAGVRHVFYSEDPELISEYKKYFQHHSSKGDDKAKDFGID